MTETTGPVGPRFVLTADHLKLLPYFHIAWGGGDLPFGCPQLNAKRPMLTGDPVLDVCRILGWCPAGQPADEVYTRATTLYGEMLYVVQIIFQLAGRWEVVLGPWRRNQAVTPWRWEPVE